jgi:hypothetical protein
MRVLVFTEILEGPAKDPLNGYTAEIPLGWKARNSEYGLIFSKGANLLVIRSKKTTDQRTMEGWKKLEESLGGFRYSFSRRESDGECSQQNHYI